MNDGKLNQLRNHEWQAPHGKISKIFSQGTFKTSF